MQEMHKEEKLQQGVWFRGGASENDGNKKKLKENKVNRPGKDDYIGCLREGNKWEKVLFDFITHQLGKAVKRGDEKDCRRMDFICEKPFDFKVRLTPFMKSLQYVGLPPEEAIAVDTNKNERYLNLDADGFLVIYLNYEPRFKTKGLFFISVKRLGEIIYANKDRLHSYKDRVNDSKNSKTSFYLKASECRKFPDEYFNELTRMARYAKLL